MKEKTPQNSKILFKGSDLHLNSKGVSYKRDSTPKSIQEAFTLTSGGKKFNSLKDALVNLEKSIK